MGRPSIISPRHVRDIEEALRLGLTVELASAYCGIHKDTFYTWISKASTHDEPLYKAFADAASRGRAKCAALQMARINKAGGEDWRAAAWIMERRFGYHRKLEQELNVGAIAEEHNPAELIERILAARPLAESLVGAVVHEDEE